MMIELLVVLLVCLVLIVINGFCVAAEFALAGASRAAFKARAERGEWRARFLRDILANPVSLDRYIAACQIGITIASIGIGMYGEHRLAEIIGRHLGFLGESSWIAAHTVASLAALLLLTYLHIVFGEMIPKAMALQSPDRMSSFAIGPLAVMKGMFYPLVWGLNVVGLRVMALFGMKRHFGAEHYRSADDLTEIIEASAEQGEMGIEMKQVLKDILQFSELTSEEVMVPRVRVVGLPVGATPEICRQTIRTAAHTRYPVYEGTIDQIVGFAHIKQLFPLIETGRSLDRSFIHPVAFLPETATLDRVLTAMQREKTQIVVIMEEQGGTSGIITYEDLFEEVVGEVPEGRDKPSVRVAEDGSLHVLGTAREDEIGEALDIPLSFDPVETLSGLVLMLLNRPPVVGDIVEYQGLTIRVTAVERRAAKEAVVSVKRVKGADEDEG